MAVVRVVATAKDERARGGRRGQQGGKRLRGGEGEQRHGGEAPGVARVIALKLPPGKNTPSKRVPTRRGCLVSSRLGFFARAKTPRDISGRQSMPPPRYRC